MAISYPRPQPYRLDWSNEDSIEGVNGRLATLMQNADEMFDILFKRPTLAIDPDADSTTTTTTGGTTTVDLATGVTGRLPLANIVQGTALSVLGVAGNATADYANIAAGTDGQVLRRSGTALAFGAVDLASANAVTGNLATSHLNSGTNASASTFWRGDGSWASLANTLGVSDLDAILGAMTNRFGVLIARGTGNAIDAIGVPAAALLGTLSTVADNTSAWARYTSSGTINTGAVLSTQSNTGVARPDWNPYLVVRIRTNASTVANSRFFVGWMDIAATTGTGTTGIANDNPTALATAGARYSASVDSNWVGVTSDGAGNQTVAATNLGSVAANTEYIIKVTLTGTTSAVIEVNGVSTTITTNLPPSGTNLKFVVALTDKNGAVKTIDINKLYWRAN